MQLAMSAYDTTVLGPAVWAAGSSAHLVATPRLCAGYHHQNSHLQLSTVLRIIILIITLMLTCYLVLLVYLACSWYPRIPGLGTGSSA